MHNVPKEKEHGCTTVWITICTWEGGEGRVREEVRPLWVTGGIPASIFEQWKSQECVLRTAVTCLLLIFPEVGGHGGRGENEERYKPTMTPVF